MTQTSADAWRPSSMACSDRKSTRLNSSHSQISYAVFCLKKKKNTSELQSQSNLVCRLLLERIQTTGLREATVRISSQDNVASRHSASRKATRKQPPTNTQ